MLRTFSKLQESYEGFETEFMRILTYDLEEGFSGSYKSYGYHRLCTILDGVKGVKVDRQDQFIYDKDAFVLLPPNSTVEMEILTPTKAIVYDISDRLIDRVRNRVEAIDDVKQFKGSLRPQDYDQHLKKVMDNIQQTLVTGTSDKEFLLDLQAQELVYWMIRGNRLAAETKQVSDTSDSVLQRALEILEADGNEGVQISQIANSLHMTASNLSYLFRKHYEMSPKEYQNVLRMKRAKKLLEEGRTVTETAMDVGFSNLSYFIRLYKERYGITPKQHMKHGLFRND